MNCGVIKTLHEVIMRGYQNYEQSDEFVAVVKVLAYYLDERYPQMRQSYEFVPIGTKAVWRQEKLSDDRIKLSDDRISLNQWIGAGATDTTLVHKKQNDEDSRLSDQNHWARVMEPKAPSDREERIVLFNCLLRRIEGLSLWGARTRD